MSRTPDDLQYTPTHEWVRIEPDGTATVGITDFAQESLGDIVFVEFPEPGAAVTAGSACGVVESVKAASDLNAPLSGTVTAINESIADAWERINQDAYAAWLFKLRPSDPAERAKLLDAAGYGAVAVAKS